MSRSQSTLVLRLICLALVAALFLPNWAIFLPKIHAAAVNMMQSAPPDDNLPDLDAQQTISPSDPQAPDPDPSTAEAWEPLDPDPDGSSAIKVNSSVTITSPSEGASFQVSTPVTFSATVSSDATVIQVSFMANGQLIASDKAAPYSASYSLLAPGTYTLTAVAMLSTGGSITSATPVHITITSPTTPPPSVSITSPASGARFTAPASVPLVATASAAAGRTITSVQFFQGATLIGTGSLVSSTYQYNWNSVGSGTYTVTAKATDSSGAATTSAAINVTVNAAAGPSVTLTLSPTHVPVSTPVTLTATASPSAGRTISKVDFYYNNNFIATDTTSPYSITWTPTQSIAYSLTAVATDNMGATATSAPQALTIDAPAGNPTVVFSSPASGQHFHSPASVAITVTAAAAVGSGRTISKVDFYADGSTSPFSPTQPARTTRLFRRAWPALTR